MKVVFYIPLLCLLTVRISNSEEDDFDVIISSAVGDKKVVTASGQGEIGVKLGNVTLEKFSNLQTQFWTLIRVNSDDDDSDMIAEFIAKENEQNTLTSYLHRGAHSHNQWNIVVTMSDDGPLFQLNNRRNSKCLNNKDGKLFYSVCDDSVLGQMWILKRNV